MMSVSEPKAVPRKAWPGRGMRASSTLPVLLTPRGRLVVLGIWIALGLLEASKVWITRRLAAQPIDWGTVLVGNMPWWLMWAALTPLIIALARRIRPGGKPLRFTAAHISAAVLLSLLHHAVVGFLYYHTHTRGAMAPVGGELVPMTLGLQVSTFVTGYLILNLLTYFATLGSYYGHEYYVRHREGELRSARLEASMHQARLAALRMELNPHFLFNTLNAVTGLVRRHDTVNAVRMLARLGDLLRATLEQGSDPEVPLEKEMDLLSLYLEIERVRFGSRLEVEVITEDSARTALVPPLILQPLVENAVKHGVARHSGPGRVKVTAAAEGDQLILRVVNTGPSTGMEPVGEPRQNGGIGLVNTRQRLMEMYGAAASLTVDVLAGGGACVTIHIPIIS